MSYSYYFIFNQLKETHESRMPTSTNIMIRQDKMTVIKVHQEMSGTL